MLIEILGAWNRGVSSNLKKAFSPPAPLFSISPSHPSHPLSFTPSSSTGAGKAFKTKHKTGSQARALAEAAGKRLGLEAAPPTPHGGLGVAPERLQVWLQDWGRRARRGPGAPWRGPRRSPHRVGLGDVSHPSWDALWGFHLWLRLGAHRLGHF